MHALLLCNAGTNGTWKPKKHLELIIIIILRLPGYVPCNLGTKGTLGT